MLADLNIPLAVRRKSLFWFANDKPEYEVSASFPVFLFEVPHGPSPTNAERNSHSVFYGFPKLGDRGVKLAEHGGGWAVADPLFVDRSIDPSEQQRFDEVLADWLPGVTHRVTDHAVCLYTMSPDEHFIVDKHPIHPQVVYSAGLSGHGFKFAPVLWAALADLALSGKTQLPIDFLSLARLRLEWHPWHETSRQQPRTNDHAAQGVKCPMYDEIGEPTVQHHPGQTICLRHGRPWQGAHYDSLAASHSLPW